MPYLTCKYQQHKYLYGCVRLLSGQMALFVLQAEITMGCNVDLTACGVLLMVLGDIRERERDFRNITGLIASFPGTVSEQTLLPKVRSIALK